MTDFAEGDLVEAVKGDTVIRGRLDHRAELKLTMALASDMLHLKASGYVVTVVERATPPLPTEMYSVIRYRSFLPLVRHEDGLWYHVGFQGYMHKDGSQVGRTSAQVVAERGTNFEVLEPASIIVKRISDWLWEHRNDIKGTDSDEWRALCYDLEKTFGVTEP